MGTARRLYLSMVAALCFILLFSQTAHQADCASRVTAKLNLSTDGPVKLAAALPPQRDADAANAIVALPDAVPAAALLPCVFAMSLFGLLLASAATARHFADSLRAAFSIQTQHGAFAIRI